MVDELAAVAKLFAKHSGWPQGWIGVRFALRKGSTDFKDAERAKLEELSQILRPANLADMIRTYAFSKEWGALDIAEADDEG